MQLQTIVNTVNNLLAGEQLTFEELITHLNAVIDDINNKLNAKFPSFSQFNNTAFPQYPNYNFFPDSYIRSVIAVGAAYYFYITDEEGSQDAAPSFMGRYAQNIFFMERDYINKVPEEFQAGDQGSFGDPHKIRGIYLSFYDLF